MTTVVTGASGHVGVNVVQALRDRGEDVRATVHRNQRSLAGLGVETVWADVLDPASLREALRGADHVIHLAARISITGDPDGLVRRVNVDGAANVAQAARKAGARLVHVSSVHAFDLANGPGLIDEAHPRSTRRRNYAYDRSKTAGEAQVRKQITLGLDATILNPTAIIGPTDPGPSRMGQVFLDLRERRIPALVAGAFDFVDVRDVADTCLAAREHGATGRSYLVGGHHATIRQIAEAAEEVTGIPPPKTTVPLAIAALGVPFARIGKQREPKFTFESLGALRHGKPVDSARARKVLGHRARPLAKTMADTYAWFEEVGM